MVKAMMMLHLVLARTKAENDESLSQTFKRRIDKWPNAEFAELFQESKASQQRNRKSAAMLKRDEFHCFDQEVTSGKTSNARRCLVETHKGQVRSLKGIIMGVLGILYGDTPNFGNDKTIIVEVGWDNTLHYHPSISLTIWMHPSILRTAMKTHDSHDPSGLDAYEWHRILSNLK